MMKTSKSNKGLKRRVLITGATGGIGRATAIRFAKEGWDILCHYRSSRKKAEELKKAINDFGVNCQLLKADFSSKGQFRSFLNEIRTFSVDSLVNNAGTYVTRKYFNKLTLSDITATFTVNAFVPMLLAANVFVGMKKRNFGRIVSISSIAAKYGGSAHSMHYGCSKLALEGLTKTLAREGAEHNVLVNTVRPGVIATEFHAKFPKDMKKRIAMIPLKKVGTPEDVADMVYYIGSDRNNFITNEIITVSGGE